MAVPMMNIRVMGVTVAERRVLVLVEMRLGPVPVKIVSVPMVLVVCVQVRVPQRIVPMSMLVPLGKMQCDPRRH